jgi:hypothetical protein
MILAPEENLPEFNYIREFEEERVVIATVIRDGLGAGEVKGNPRKLASVLMGMEFFASLENLFTGRATLTRKNAASLVDVLLDGCSVRQGLPIGMLGEE